LNDIASIVWRECETAAAPRDIANAVRADIAVEDAADRVDAVLAELESKRLIELEPDFRSQASRRRMIVRGAAAATAVLLPTITSVQAPTPAEAQGSQSTCLNLPPPRTR
jgi:negative regulator of sigma E activity